MILLYPCLVSTEILVEILEAFGRKSKDKSKMILFAWIALKGRTISPDAIRICDFKLDVDNKMTDLKKFCQKIRKMLL